MSSRKTSSRVREPKLIERTPTPCSALHRSTDARSAAKESPAGHYLIEVDDGVIQPALLAAVTAWCADRGVLPSSLQIESRTLEDVFLELTGKDLRG